MGRAADEVATGMGGWGMAPWRHNKADSRMVKRSLNVQIEGIEPWMAYQDVGGSLR